MIACKAIDSERITIVDPGDGLPIASEAIDFQHRQDQHRQDQHRMALWV